MNLDLPTLMFMQSFALACAGAILLLAWLQNKKVLVFLLWGAATVGAAAGIVSLKLGVMLGEPAWSALGGILLSLQSSTMWKVARTIDRKPASFLIVILGPTSVGLAGAMPGLRDLVGSWSLGLGAAYVLLAAASLWAGRSERLAARWPLLILTSVHGTALAIGTYSTLSGSTGQDAVPALASLFGFIYFESIVYAVGTAAFILALIKERNEAAGRKAARVDSLTGIANRAGFMEKAEWVVNRCRQNNATFSVMMFDLDRFKNVNDGHGHAAGDAVLRKFCEIAESVLRPNDVFGRLGGEEFAVVSPGLGIEAAAIRAERIRSAFALGGYMVDGHEVYATVSCGIAASVNGDQTLSAMLGDADAALYRAKGEGRNRVASAEHARPEGGLPEAIRVA